ncbi:MAG: hypothetical protein ACOH2K_17725 [Burkholderiaceae bacterium]
MSAASGERRRGEVGQQKLQTNLRWKIKRILDFNEKTKMKQKLTLLSLVPAKNKENKT